MSAYCPHCSHVLDTELEFPADAGWCQHCREAFAGQPSSLPGWLLGTLVLLVTLTLR